MKDNFLPVRVFMGSVTNVSNRPFRRLVTELGADATLSEMVIAHYASHGGRQDLALMKRGETEKIFGIQLVGGNPSQLDKAAQFALDAKPDFIDFNCACPHRSVVAHRSGAYLLQKPKNLAPLLETLRKTVNIPLTIKIRKGFDEFDNVVDEVVHIAEDCGIDAVFIHARTKFAQYRGPNDWQLIESVAEKSCLPIIGCGDLAHGVEVIEKMKNSPCAGFALARGALMKPWIFKEIKEGHTLDPSSEERLELLRKLANYSLDDFGYDAYGHAKARKFLHEQMTFLARYVPVGAYGRELPMQEREHEWTPRNELEKLMATTKKEAYDELLHLVGFDDNIVEKDQKNDKTQTTSDQNVTLNDAENSIK